MNLTSINKQKQSNKQIISSKQILSFEILKMPILNLREYILNETMQNPLIDIKDDIMYDDSFVPSTDSKNEYYINDNSYYKSPLDYYSEEKLFSDYLIEQLNLLKLTEKEHYLCTYIIYNLNEQGYFEYNIEDVASELSIPEFDVLQALFIVQSLTPTGVATKNLQECLINQLVESNNFSEKSLHLIKYGLDYLAKKNYKKLDEILDCNREETLDTIKIILGFNPIPSSGFRSKYQNEYITPDAEVSVKNSGFTITINDKYIPKIHINSEYIELKDEDNDYYSYIKNKKEEALFLINSIENRKQLMVKILFYILEYQKEFFMDNNVIKPMRMKDIAESIGISISTVSRAVNGKYISTNKGIIKVKDLFASDLNNNSNSYTPMIIKEKIKSLINNESKNKPFTDKQLAKLLSAIEIDITRRTVAKYREECKISSSIERKHLYN